MEKNNYPDYSPYSEKIWSSQVDEFLSGTMKQLTPDPANAPGASSRSRSRPDSRRSYRSPESYRRRKSPSPYLRSRHHKKSSKSSGSKHRHGTESSSMVRRSLPHSRSSSVSSYPRVARYPKDDETNSDWEEVDSHKKDKTRRKQDKHRTRSKSKEKHKKSKKNKKKSGYSSKKNHKDRHRNDSFSSDFSESEIPSILDSVDKHSSCKQAETSDRKSPSSSAFNLNDISTLLNKYGKDEEDHEVCETIRKEIIKERALEKESCAKIFKSKIKNRDKGTTDDNVKTVPDDKIEDSNSSDDKPEESALNNVCEVADLDVEIFNSDDFWNQLDMELPASELDIEKSASNIVPESGSPSECLEEELPFIQLENEENIRPNLLHGQINYYGKVLELLSSISNHLGPLEASILSLNTEYRTLSPEKCKDLLVENEQLLDTVLKSIEGLLNNPVTADEDMILFEVVRDELNMTMKSIAHHARLSKCFGLNLNQIASHVSDMNSSQVKEFIKHSLLYEGYANIPHKDFSSIHSTVLDIQAKLS